MSDEFEKDTNETPQDLETKEPIEQLDVPESDESSTSPDVEQEETRETPPKKQHAFKRFLSTKKGKVIAGLVILIVIVGVIIAVPFTRYGTLGLVVKKQVTLTVVDSKTNRPVSSAQVTIGSQVVKTDNSGKAIFKSVSVGIYSVKIAKQYYSDQTVSYTVPVITAPSASTTKLVATGRQVSISVSNKITGAGLEGVTITASGTSEATREDGSSVIILPANKDIVEAVLTKDGYNSETVSINVNDDTQKNEYKITPSGSLYYLSKITGTINVMKANLDGTDAKVVVAGTGKESSTDTVILSARDWKYSTLLAKRDSDKDKLYLIDSTTDSLTTIDEGDATFNLVGWSGHNFIYRVDRNTANYWDNHRQALKSYNADTKKLTTLYQTVGSGTSSYNNQYELIYSIYILDNEIVYLKAWSGNGSGADPSKSMTLVSVNASSNVAKTVHTFDNSFNIGYQAKLYKPQELYIRLQAYPADPTFYEYTNGKLGAASVSDEIFNNAYPTYLLSPSGNKTFWTDPRDGKNTLLIGDQDAEAGVQIASLSDFSAYGWYSDDYILLSKNGSELYIAAANKAFSATNQPLKVTNYHKPQITYYGYGSGYGGQ